MESEEEGIESDTKRDGQTEKKDGHACKKS